MTFNTELATVLAQVTPIFLLMLMFERLSLGKAEPGYRIRWVTAGYFIRQVSATLCALIFTISLLVIAFGEDLTGGIVWYVMVPLAVLIVLLWVTINFKLETMREQAIADAQTEDNGQPKNESQHNS